MPKPITAEMLHAMSLDQRKTLFRNATSLDTPAAHAVLELLAQDDLMGRPADSAASAKRAAASAGRKRVKTSSAVEPKAKPIRVAFGRQA